MDAESIWRERVSIGGIDVTGHLTGGGFKTSIREAATAWFEIDAAKANEAIADLFAEVEWMFPASGFRAFEGHVVKVSPVEGGRIRVECQSLPDLETSIAPRFESFELEAPESIHFVARSSGLREDQLRIHGFDKLLAEDMTTLVPLVGLAVHTPTPVDDGMKLITVEAAGEQLAGFDPTPWQADFDRATAFASVTGRASSLWEHEDFALRQVDAFLAWLQCRAMYGLPVLPDGRPNNFERASAKTRTRRLGFATTSAASGRRWIHELDVASSMAIFDFGRADPSWKVVKAGVSETTRQAMLALRRTTLETDATQQVVALWDAVEFFVAPAKLPRVFTPAEVRALRRSVASENEELRDRALGLLESINSPPLLAKFRLVCEQIGVPLRDEEMDLLTELRRMRNRAAHGSASRPSCTSDQIDRGRSIVARAVIFQTFRPVVPAS